MGELPPFPRAKRLASPRLRAFRRRLAAAALSLGAASMVPIGIARADVASSMNSFFNDAGGAANVTGPTAYQGQSAGYYSLGNAWTRFPQKSVSPFNLQLPSARAGCGGIDLFTGSFSFINASEMVAMLKATANNALGFAFKLAIDSVSPEIGKIMGEFQQAAQQMNQMNISSCEAAQGLVGAVWPKMQGARSTICTAVGNSQGVFSDWARSRQGCGADGQIDDVLSGNNDPNMNEHIPGEPRNYTWEALKRSQKFGAFDAEFSEYLMTVVGTIIVNKAEGSNPASIQYIGPAEDAVVTALLDGTQTGNTAKILTCTDDDKCLQVSEQNLSVPTNVALRPRIKAMITSMRDKIRTDAALSSAEQQLLSLTTVPLYKLLAVEAMAHGSFTDSESDALAEIVAVNLLSSMIENMLDRVTQSQVHFQPADQATAETWRKQLGEARSKYAERDLKVKNTLNISIALINKSIALESTLQNAMSPGMAAALNFSRGLNVHGLN
ncbi:conjugative transfer pilus assembly protein TraH [Sphingopyxis flava]|uniref:Conjugative transfer pilus assembly protein TraH n=2 Tax=Sphingopyxis flava TaxID=1507287 RepID=A0A1T5FRV7_9SPHN|nr:conjugative transfer pilus assembly protein TraH [Sphingopyxis flava]